MSKSQFWLHCSLGVKAYREAWVYSDSFQLIIMGSTGAGHPAKISPGGSSFPSASRAHMCFPCFSILLSLLITQWTWFTLMSGNSVFSTGYSVLFMCFLNFSLLWMITCRVQNRTTHLFISFEERAFEEFSPLIWRKSISWRVML